MPGATSAAVELRRFPATNVFRGPVSQGPVRPDFHVVGVVTGGAGRHTVDFETHPLTSPAVFWLRPGQVHQILDAAQLHGVAILFTTRMLDPTTPVGAFGVDAIRPSQWACAASDDLPRTALRHLELLLTEPCPDRDIADALRLALSPLVRAAPESAPEGTSAARAVFERFAAAVEAEYPRQHRVRDYEQLVHAGARTIDRSVRQVRGLSAKRYLDRRIALEARRRLATTDLTVAHLATELGFTEATNFVKFYRRMTGTTPSAQRSAAR